MPQRLERFIEEHVALIAPLERDSAIAYWNFTTTGKKEYEAEVTRLNIEIRKIYADKRRFQEFRELVQAEPPAEPLLARQVTLLTNAFIANQMDETTIEELTRREVEIESLFNTFRAELHGKKVTDNQIKEILRDSDDLELRRDAWEASKQVGAIAAPKLIELVEMRNDVARSIGFSNFYRMHMQLQELDEDEVFQTFEELDQLGRPLYQAYKADLDAQLARRFGLRPEELRPWHYSDPFFQNAPAADHETREFLTEIFKGQNIEALTSRFYHAIGLDVDDVLERSDLYEREGKQQHAYCINIDRQRDVRVLANIQPDEYWTGTMLHECGHAAYDKYIDPSLPYILRQPAHTLFTEAVAMLMGRLSSDPEWLLTYIVGVSEDDLQRIRNRLVQQARGQLLIISRWVPVMSAFERALYTDPRQPLNSLWWDLEERLQMVPRPEGRDAPDWAAKIHFSTAPVYYHNYLLGEMIASQLKHYMDTVVLKGNSNLNRRYVSDSAVGHYLIEKVFRPGATRHWQDALAYATGERLRPQYLIDQARG